MAKRAWCQHTCGQETAAAFVEAQESRRQQGEEGPARAPWGGAPRAPTEAPPQSLCRRKPRPSQHTPVGLYHGGACADLRLPGLSTSRRGAWCQPRREDRLILLDSVDFRILQSVGSPSFVFWTKLNTLASNCHLFDYRWHMIY